MGIGLRAAVLAAAISTLAPMASAQAVASSPAQPAPAANPAPTAPVAAALPAAVAPAPPHIPAGTLVDIQLTEAVGTHAFKRGDTFTIALAAPVALDGRIILPAGVTGLGQVVDSQPSGALGKPAKLLLAARYLDYNGARIPLHGMKLGGAGEDKVAQIEAINMIPYVGILADFEHGGEIDIPTGTHASAKLGADIDASGAPSISAAALTPPAAPAPSTASAPTASTSPKALEQGKTQ